MNDRQKSSFQKIFSGGAVLFVGLMLEMGISFLAKVVIARFLGPVEYGAVSIAVTIMVMASTFVLFGLDTGVGRYLPRLESAREKRGVVRSAFELSFPVTVLVSGLLFVFAGKIATQVFADPSLSSLIQIGALGIPFVVLTRLAVDVGRGNQQSAPRVVLINIVVPLTRFGGVGVVVVLGFGTFGIAFAHAAAYVLASVIGLYYIWHMTPFGLRGESTPMRREMLLYSAPLMIAAAMSVIFSDVDTLLLGYFTSTQEVGIYNVVYPITQLLTLFLSSFTFLFMPVISELHSDGEDGDMARIYEVVTKWIFITTLPVFLILTVFPASVISLTFGIEYVSGATALVVLSFAFFTHALSGPNGATLTSIGETRFIMIANVVAAALNILGNIVLIPRYGIVGAAAATAGTYILLNGLYAYRLYQHTGIHPLTTALLKPATFGTVSVLVLQGVTAVVNVSPIVLVGVASVFGLLYGVVILRFGVEEEEVMLMLSFEEKFGVDLTPLKRLVDTVRVD